MRLAAAVLCLWCAVAIGCTTTESAKKPVSPQATTKPDLYAQVAKWVAAGDTEKAIGGFKELIAARPDDLQVRVEFARFLVGSGRYEEARPLLASVLARSPEMVDAVYTLAILEGETGHVDKEQAILEELVAKHPENANANASLGQIYFSERQLDKAKASFQASLRSDPANLSALMGYGQILLQEGEAKEALLQFDKVIDREPSFSFAYAGRGQAKAELDEVKGAEQDFTKAIALNPGYYWHYIDRGKLRLILENNREGALADFSKAIEIDPKNFLGYVYRAGLYDDEHEIDEALQDYRTLLSLRPDYYFVYRPYAILLYMKREWELAREYFIKAYLADQSDPGPQLLAALCLLKEGKKQEATRFLTSILPSIPRTNLFFDLDRLFLDPGTELTFVDEVQAEKNPAVQTRFLFYLACYYELQGRKDLAQKYFLQVQGHHFAGMYEYRLNEWELSKYLPAR